MNPETGSAKAAGDRESLEWVVEQGDKPGRPKVSQSRSHYGAGGLLIAFALSKAWTDT